LLGFLHLPKNKVNYSHIEEINNIIIGILMVYEYMDELKCKYTMGIGITIRKR
jgi:hypothetical protein